MIAVSVLGAQTKQTIKTVPVSSTSPVSGKTMFATYCAACHGVGGKGDGPAAVALKNRPTDLTQLSAKNGGKYPELFVVATLNGREVDAHGSQEMPIWGDLFRSLESNDRSDVVHMRIGNLTSYIGSLQAK